MYEPLNSMQAIYGPIGVFFEKEPDANGVYVNAAPPEGETEGELKAKNELLGPTEQLNEDYGKYYYMEDRAQQRLDDLKNFWFQYVDDTDYYPNVVFSEDEINVINDKLSDIKSMTEAYGADVVSMFDGLTAFLKANESLITDMSVPMYLVSLALRLFLCLFGNNLYYRFVIKHVSKIRQNAPTDHVRKALLDSEGGTSIWNILGCFGIYCGALVGLYMVLMLAFM